MIHDFIEGGGPFRFALEQYGRRSRSMCYLPLPGQERDDVAHASMILQVCAGNRSTFRPGFFSSSVDRELDRLFFSFLGRVTSPALPFLCL